MNSPNTVMHKADDNTFLFAEWSSNFVSGQIEFEEITKIYLNPRSSTRMISSIAAAIVLSAQANTVSPSETSYQPYPHIMVDPVKLNFSQNPRVDFDSPVVGVLEKTKLENTDKELEAIFGGLAKTWREETGGYSLTMRRYVHSSYQTILTLEPKREVIKLILLELQKRPDRWFEALKVLTKSNPATQAKSFDETVQAWIEWGKSEKYIS